VPEWGNPARPEAGLVTPGGWAPGEATGGTETSQYPEEEKATAMPLVAASERGTAQTLGAKWPGSLCPRGVVGAYMGRSQPSPVSARRVSRRTLERAAKGGESPVGEDPTPARNAPRVPRGTGNPAGSWGDHPPRLNTLGDR